MMKAIRMWVADWDEAGWEAYVMNERIPLRAYLAHWLTRFEWACHTWAERAS